MTKLNLTAKGRAQELILAYLQENTSDVLAEKINNGVVIQKDEKRLISKKDLDGFMAFANSEARKLAEKGANSACVEDSVVYGWAIHYFEENGIEGKLYNEDGTEYKAQKPVTKSTTPAVPYTPPKPAPKPQLSLFDMLGEQKKPADDPEPIDEEEDEVPTEEELAEVMEQERQTPIPPVTKQPSPFYQHYLNIQNYYSDAIVALRVGDFYEVYGENAVKAAKELDMTLTGRDCGLEERIPMVGFPYHATDSYISKLVARGYKVTIAEDMTTNNVTVKEPDFCVDEETGEVLPVEEMRKFDGDIEEPSQQVVSEDEDDDLPPFDVKAFDPEALSILDELFGDFMILR